MKAEYIDFQGDFGEVRLFPERVDDLWHLSHLIGSGDLVFATTFRSVEVPQDKIRPEKREKRQVRLGVRADRVEFHPFALRLRVTGLIEHGIEAGSYHTLNLEPGYDISVVKRWSSADRARVERAIRSAAFEAVHILSVEEGEASLFRIRSYGPEQVASVIAGTGKGGEGTGRQMFFDEVLALAGEVTGPLILAGPGFVKEELVHRARSRGDVLATRALVVETRRSGAGAVREVIGLGTLDRLTGDLQLALEVRLLEELLSRIAKGDPVAYGREDVARAVGYCAVRELLVIDTLIRDPEVAALMEQAEAQRAQVAVLSTRFEPGEQLEALGGIAALLRFAVGVG
jgi:protein pelota